MRLTTLCLAVALLAPGAAWSQVDLQPRRLIESPTAGLLPRGSFGIDFRVYDGNGILGAVEIGLFERAMIGFSMGGQHITGNGDVEWNPSVEFSARARLVEEGKQMPALALGYNSQGYGAYDEELERYTRKSKGIYAVISRNFGSSLGEAGIHAGVNRSFEDGDEDRDLTGFVGLDKQVGPDFALLVEYDFALNDNEDNSLGSGRGFLNAGIRWFVSRQFMVEFDAKNVFRNGRRNPNPDREIRIGYFERF